MLVCTFDLIKGDRITSCFGFNLRTSNILFTIFRSSVDVRIGFPCYSLLAKGSTVSPDCMQIVIRADMNRFGLSPVNFRCINICTDVDNILFYARCLYCIEIFSKATPRLHSVWVGAVRILFDTLKL